MGNRNEEAWRGAFRMQDQATVPSPDDSASPFPEGTQAETSEHLAVGRRGEALACRFFWKRGYRILARNHRGRRGEIDLIAEKNGRVHFIEVKTRTSESLGRPEERVDQRKRERLRETARAYLDGYRERPPLGFQFDVFSALLDERGRPVRQEWAEDAF